MRFPSRLLAANMWLAVFAWLAYLVIITLVTVAIAIWGDLDESVWEKAVQLTRWYALFVGVALVTEFLPLFIAHGQSRRQFGFQAAVTIAVFAPFLAFLLVISFLLEALLYGLTGWTWALGQAHLFTAPTQAPMIFLEYTVMFVAWLVAGVLVSAAFYRWQGGGLLAIIPAAVMVLFVQSTIGDKMPLPFITFQLGFNLPDSALGAVLAAAGTFVVGLGLTWLIIRDVPLRNKVS
ncbi:hypothetical protein [Nonomuraea africana]|uniref:ABC transporter permease n=1 Tax=Nonomuraea africana TaxID=46171 RepID=A0ABR9KKX5_9ACTN|nr:hypothetical protein [Nonomuraea africana]MBE1562668.1 hypothetical protein [Nonomuraea africana]